MSLDRDRFAQLVTDILATHDAAPDEQAAERLLANALLNYVSETEAGRLEALRDGLPWLQAYLEACLGADPDGVEPEGVGDVADSLIRGGVTRALADATVRRHLSGVKSGSEQAAEALGRLARMDRRLVEVAELGPEAMAERLIEDSGLLARAIEACRERGERGDRGEQGEQGKITKLAARFPRWSQFAADTPHARALAVLDALEAGDQSVFEAPNGPLHGLDERARNFEQSLARNMGRHGLLVAVRAALAFAPSPTALDAAGARSRNRRATDDPLYEFGIFRDQPELAALARALVRIRGRFQAHLRGAAPLTALEPWADYLRGPCRDFADAREISYSEATSFGHYCLHLMNICDLAAIGRVTDGRVTDGGVTEAARTALMGAEDEIKEFALAGQRQQPDERVGALDRYDVVRWKTRGPLAYITDRVGRMLGAWRREVERGPLGAPAKLEAETRRAVRHAWQSLARRTPDGTLDGVDSMLRQCRLTGVDWLEELKADDVVTVLCVGLANARDLPGVDVTRPFVVDLRPLEAWWDGRESKKTGNQTGNQRVLRAIISRRDAASSLERSAGPPRDEGQKWEGRGREVGVIAEVSREEYGRAGVTLDIRVDDELRALLTLLDNSRADADEFWAALEARLDAMLGSEGGAGADADERQEGDASASGQSVASAMR